MIITDFNKSSEIRERFSVELPRVYRWASTHDDVIYARFPDEPLKALDSEGEWYEDYIPEGIIPWVSPRSGDTWAVAVFHRKNDISALMRIPFYYWNTIGSIGFMIESTMMLNENTKVRGITTYSSHCMMRYKDRLNMGYYSSFELITHILGRTFLNIPVFNEKDGKLNLDIICADGIFRGSEDLEDADFGGEYQLVMRMKTFLSWKDLGKKEHDRLWYIWETYQMAYTK